MGHRKEENCIQGFNLAVIDVDGTVSIKTARALIKEYTYLLYTTKRSTDTTNRFRIIFPMSHTLQLNKDDYKEFMENLYAWLPFEADTATAQRARKWLSHDGDLYENEGDLLDVRLFIPKTKKAEEFKSSIVDLGNLSNIERWFVTKTGKGNRSNQLIKYGLMLVDTDMAISDIQDKVILFNNKLPDSLPDNELYSTIFQTLSKKVHERDK